MTAAPGSSGTRVSTHMPLARHDIKHCNDIRLLTAFLLTCLLRGMTASASTHIAKYSVSTHMPLARHDLVCIPANLCGARFYSHASCEA